jgi:hypothetical protein
MTRREETLMREVTIPVTFKIGTIEELGYGGFKTTWLESDHAGAKFDLTSGAGVGSPLLEGSARRDGTSVYAQADIQPLGQVLFGELERELNRQEPPRGTETELAEEL